MFFSPSHAGPLSTPWWMLRALNDANNNRRKIFTHSSSNQCREALIMELLDCKKLFSLKGPVSDAEMGKHDMSSQKCRAGEGILIFWQRIL